VSRDLIDAVSAAYGLPAGVDCRDLGDSFNLNVLVSHGDQRLVVRMYRPSTTTPRLEAVQRIRGSLLDEGLPFAPLRTTVDGRTYWEFEGRLIEGEEYVPSETYMDSFARIRLGMPALARVHNRLRLAPMDEWAAHAPIANHVDAERMVDVVAAGVDVVRGNKGSHAESRYADVAESLAPQVQRAEAGLADALPRQLVHGDFWDDNVRFVGSRIVLITDLDFMGLRPRIDDLALTLFYTNERLGRDDLSAQRRHQLRELVDAYDEALTVPLSRTERYALPYAIARTTLCFAEQLTHGDAALASEIVRRRGPAWVWAQAVINDPAWTNAFVH
jgi:Ser/Thr protein kinase RdoA (MazF antagonist)